MTGILELEKTKERISQDTWLMKLPDEICDREGLSRETLVSMTIRDGGIHSSFVRPPSDELRKISRELLERDREVHQRLKELGD